MNCKIFINHLPLICSQKYTSFMLIIFSVEDVSFSVHRKQHINSLSAARLEKVTIHRSTIKIRK